MLETLKSLKNFTKIMKNFSFRSFDSDELPTLFAALKRTFDAADVSFYLIGARARDVWFLPEKKSRITRDVDWIAASEEDAVFEEIKERLIKYEGFTETQNPYSLLSSEKMTVDLLPFIQNKDRSLEGLNEVFKRGTEGVLFDNSAVYQVATLPAIVFLKLIAWDDRPDYRLKDLGDIAQILDNYFDLESDDIYDNHNDLFDEIGLNEIAAHVIGRKIRYIIGDSIDLKTRLSHILTEKRAIITQRMAANDSKPESVVNQILNHLLAGILEN
jgi:predicted nucleotidyltransferase